MLPNSIPDSKFLPEEAFVRRLHLEQRRTERSRRPFVFVLLESANLLNTGRKGNVCEQIVQVIVKSFRETDIKGWHETDSAIGLIFTEIGDESGDSIGKALVEKLRKLLLHKLTLHQISQIQISFYVFPEDWDKQSGSKSAVLYPSSERSRRASQLVKRCIDIAGSAAALALGAPVFLAIAAAVKLTSKGPILYRQERVGQYGRKFTFLKFRSMKVNNDSAIHEDFVKGMITGKHQAMENGNSAGEKAVYKLTNDPRITSVGQFLRKTSLDEIPQFLNVLRGDMSLVGPRPPIPYEVEVYDIWHRRRLLEVKPGITGLWQVKGRCRTTFDEMVRLDLEYAKTWTVWMDLKILLQTPRAVVAGDGAY